jgi:hypothetical protein
LFVLKKKKTMSYSSGPGQWDPKHEQDGRKSRSGQMEINGHGKNLCTSLFFSCPKQYYFFDEGH